MCAWCQPSSWFNNASGSPGSVCVCVLSARLSASYLIGFFSILLLLCVSHIECARADQRVSQNWVRTHRCLRALCLCLSFCQCVSVCVMCISNLVPSTFAPSDVFVGWVKLANSQIRSAAWFASVCAAKRVASVAAAAVVCLFATSASKISSSSRHQTTTFQHEAQLDLCLCLCVWAPFVFF